MEANQKSQVRDDKKLEELLERIKKGMRIESQNVTESEWETQRKMFLKKQDGQ